MPNYQNSCIYKIVCKDTLITDFYVGSTTSFRNRKYTHKSDCNNIKSKNYNSKVYNFIRKNGGFNNWDIILIADVVCNNKKELVKFERKYYEELNPKMNSNYPTRTRQEYYENNKDKLKKYYEYNKDKLKKYYQNNKDKFKKYRKDNIDKIKLKEKIYRAKNKDKLKDYYQKNIDIIKTKSKEYRDNNKELVKKQKNKTYEKNKHKYKLKKPCKFCFTLIVRHNKTRHYNTLKCKTITKKLSTNT